MKRSFIMIGLHLFAFGSFKNFAPKIASPPYEKKIVVTVPSYNNEEYFEKNLESIFSQNYSAYRVIYIDDASTDNTFEKVSAFIKEKGFEDKVLLIRNTKNKGAMANHYTMGHLAEDDEIIVTVDGDDWLPHNEVFKRVNQAYHDESVWVTYGTDEAYPVPRASLSRPIPLSIIKEKKYRGMRFLWTHLRTYYGWLFKKIPSTSFIDPLTGKFYSTACDVAIMIHLFDLAQEHVYMIPEVIYTYNTGNRRSDGYVDPKNQVATEKRIKERTPL